MLFVNFLKKNAEAGQAFFKKLLLVYKYYIQYDGIAVTCTFICTLFQTL